MLMDFMDTSLKQLLLVRWQPWERHKVAYKVQGNNKTSASIFQRLSFPERVST